MKPVTASLDPDTFRHLEPPTSLGKINVSQQDYGMQVRDMTEMRVPCKCGRPLCGAEFELLVDPRGYAVYAKGVCLRCGVQSAIYMSKEVKPNETEARMEREIAEMVRGVDALRVAAPDAEEAA